MRNLRQAAVREDIPVSEVIRRATEAWLDRFPASPKPAVRKVPVVHLGKCSVSAAQLRELIYE
jgi:hypothetical protein